MTTAGLVVLPSSTCKSESCKGHHSYSPILSNSSVDINQDGEPVDPAGGARAPRGSRRDKTKVDYQASHGKATDLEGVLVKDDLCMGNRIGNSNEAPQPLCPKAYIVAATKEGDEVFGSRPEDGMIGLARSELSLTKDFNILERVTATGLKSQFAFFVDDDASSGEITFGGYDKNRAESALVWAPVAAPEEGHWLVHIESVYVGSKRLEVCRSPKTPCVGLVSTGSPTLMFPEAGDSKEVLDTIQSGRSTASGCNLPDLSFELKGGVRLTLAVEDYAGPSCEPEVQQHLLPAHFGGANLVLLGEPLFRRYYTVFDWEKMRIGFARSKVVRDCQRLQNAGFPLDQFACTWRRDKSDEL